MKKIMILISLFSNFIFAQSDSGLNIEHQIRICESDHSILSKLNITNVVSLNSDSKMSQVYYVETPNLDYQKNDLSIRIRAKTKKIEVTVKKRYQNITVNGHGNVICELDKHGGQKEYSCKINFDTTADKFNEVLKNKRSWTDLLSKEQEEFLKDNNGWIDHSFVYGILNNQRFQWNDPNFGLITLDLVHDINNEKNMFHEISIRYSQSKEIIDDPKFEKYIQNNKLIKCSNQIDWSVNKFDIFTIQNN